MKATQWFLILGFSVILNDVYALCQDGIITFCEVNGAQGTRECINGRLGPCIPDEPPPPPPPPPPPIQHNTVFNSSTVPISTPEQIAEWQRVVNQQLGIAAKDPIGHKIGPNIAKRKGVGLNWYPVDIYKQTFVGTLHHFNFYDGWGDEADWNNFMIPTNFFAFILKDVLPIADSDDVHDCIIRDDCAEAEITPDEHFYENPYFTKRTDKSILEGKLIGTYGPWVYEEAHGNRPEIHPSEMYWWQDIINSNQLNYYLMLLQDDSNRFDRTDNYNGTIVRPWSAYPRTGEFKIAFELNDVSARPGITIQRWQTKIYDIVELYARYVKFSTIDSDDEKQHVLEYDGKALIKVNELQNEDDNISVTFAEVTRNAANTRIQGYLVIRSTIGENDRGKEGYHAVRVTETKGIESGPIIQPVFFVKQLALPAPKASILGKALPQTLHYTVIKGRPSLVGDADIQVLNGRLRSGVSLSTISSVKVVMSNNQTSALTFQSIPLNKRIINGPIATLKNLQVFNTKTLSLQSSEAGNVKIDVPTLALAPLLSTPKPLLVSDNKVAWSNFVKAAKGKPTNSIPPVKLNVVKQVQMTATPNYSVIRNNQVSLEEDSPFTEELNEILKTGDKADSKKVFNTIQPFKNVKWVFKGKNLTTGKTVIVNAGTAKAVASEIKVEFIKTALKNSNLKVTFPTSPSNHIFELTATAEMIDVFGNKGQVRKIVSSHILTSDNKDKLVKNLLPAIAKMVVMPANKNLLVASKIDGLPEDDGNIRDSFSRCARMSRLFALHSSEDNMIDLAEFQRISKIAEQCKKR